MTKNRDLAHALRRPLPLAYHPVYRFYQGGGLTRAFRGLAEFDDSWWSEDWVGSCTTAGNADPSGNVQGISLIELPDQEPFTLQELLEAYPENLVGAEFASRWGLTTGVLVKVLSPGGPVPLHAHPDRVFANQHLDSRWGKTEAWIMLDCPGDGSEPAYGGMGFKQGVTTSWIREAVQRQNRDELRDSVHRFELKPGDVWVAHAGTPHLLGPKVLFVELQEPSDHIVIPEWRDSGADEDGATMGLGWDIALDMLHFNGNRNSVLGRARQKETERRRTAGGREIGLIGDDVRFSFFDASRIEVEDQFEINDGRFYIGIVVEGQGHLEGNFPPMSLQPGQTFCCPSSLPHSITSLPSERITILRCMGPAIS